MEALLLSVIQKVNNWLVESYSYETPEYIQDSCAKLLDNLRTILDFLRNKNLGKTSCRLKYLISDVIEIAFDLDKSSFNDGIVPVQRWAGEIVMRMLKTDIETETEAESSSIIPENVGEGDHYVEDVVGLVKDVELLLKTAIFNGQHSFLIKGMVGVGKTTLARQVYNHAAVIKRFEHRAWVCVSDLSIKQVLMKLIHQVVHCPNQVEKDSLTEKLECADNQSLQQMLHRHLKGRRYLIVLDNWPKEMHLKYILKALPNKKEEKGNKLLLTCPTHIIDIFNIHEMKTLDCDESWQLFLNTIYCGKKFTSDDEHIFPKDLEKRGKEMLRSCCGLPLAIKDVGRQIAEKRRLGTTEWQQLLESVDLSATFKLMELFYEKLDSQVKLCFLHLAFFKLNMVVREERMKNICGAVGMVSEYDAHKLVRESIITVKDKNELYQIQSFEINAILHKLCIEKAKEEIGFEILTSSTGNSSRPPCQSPRHRVIICSRDRYDYSTNQDKHLISLFFHGGGYFDVSPSYWKSFQTLKTLDLEDFGLQILPESIGTLMELRYLGLRNNYIQKLPESLLCLKKLEVLDLALNFLVEVPGAIWEMDSLRHLYMSYVTCDTPLKISALRKLQTLMYISVNNLTYEIPDKTRSSLRKLGIEEFEGNSTNVSKLFASLAKLEALEHLALRGFRFKSMPCLDKLRILRHVITLRLDGLLAALPSAEDFPPYLRNLKLVNTSLDEDPMPMLGKLPYLENLKLRNAYTGREMVISHDGFPTLGSLIIQELQNLREVRVGEEVMSHLGKLEIRNCPNMEKLPENIELTTRVLQLKIVTTKRIAKKIKNYVEQSDFISKRLSLEIISEYVT